MFVASTRNVDRNPVTRAAALRVAQRSCPRPNVGLLPAPVDFQETAQLAATNATAASEAPAAPPTVAVRREDPTVEAHRCRMRSARLFGSYNPTGAYTLKLIADRVCRFHDVSPEELRGVSRKAQVALARMCVCYWARQLIGCSYPHIGRFLDRDHTTVLHAERVYRKRASIARAARRQARICAANHPGPHPVKTPGQLMPDEQRALLDGYRADEPVDLLAQAFGVRKASLYHFARQHGVRRPKGGARAAACCAPDTVPQQDTPGAHLDAFKAVHRSFTVPRECEAEYVALLVSGLSRTEAAHRLGVL